MKSLRFSIMFLALLLLPATSVFAGTDNHKGSFTISTSVQVAGKQLAPGDYTVKWEGSGSTTQVNILQSGKVVATVPARVQTLEQIPDQSSVALKTVGGVTTMTSIQFQGKNYSLEIGEGSGGGAASGDSVK
jgi:hypothetical protein